MESEIVLDGTLADNQTQIRELWSWREGITEVLGHEGGVYKYDLSIPISELYDLVNDTRDRLTEAGLVGDTPDHPVVDVVGYGHMGDANLHLNIPTRGFSKDVEKALDDTGMRSRMLLQVHDELVFEIGPGEQGALTDLVRDKMGHAVALTVPLDVSVGVGRSWHDAAH